MKRKYQVGGVLYSLLNLNPNNTLEQEQEQELKDMTDISFAVSSIHRPIMLDDDEIKIEGYSPKFSFNRNNNSNVAQSNQTASINVNNNSLRTQQQNASKASTTSPVISPITIDSKLSAKANSNTNKNNNSASMNTTNSQMVTNTSAAVQNSDNTQTPAQQVDTQTPPSRNRQQFDSNEDAWNAAWKEFGSTLGLSDERAYLYLLGQLRHESVDFKYMEEIADGQAYEGRRDLGNTKRGDGKRFKGRGPIQVTGRHNYEKIYKDFFIPNGLGEYNIVDNPDLASDPWIGSLLSLGWLATTNNGKRAIKAANKYNIKDLTYAINGGYTGLNDRTQRTNSLLKEHKYS